jgi:hypothetical protein
MFPVIKNNLAGHEYKDCEEETAEIRWLTKQEKGLYQQGT